MIQKSYCKDWRGNRMSDLRYFYLEKDPNKSTTYHIKKYFSIPCYQTESFKPMQRNSIYLSNDVSKIKSKNERKPIMRVSSFGHLSGLYLPFLNNLKYAFGDSKGTSDLIQFLFYPDIKKFDSIEMFFRIGAKNLHNLYNDLFIDDACNDDFDFCRNNSEDFPEIIKPMKAKIISLETNKA